MIEIVSAVQSSLKQAGWGESNVNMGDWSPSYGGGGGGWGARGLGGETRVGSFYVGKLR